MVKHAGGKDLVSFWFMVLNARVFPVQSGVLDHVKVTDVYWVLRMFRGVGVKKIFIEGKGGGVILRGGVKAVAFHG